MVGSCGVLVSPHVSTEPPGIVTSITTRLFNSPRVCHTLTVTCSPDGRRTTNHERPDPGADAWAVRTTVSVLCVLRAMTSAP